MPIENFDAQKFAQGLAQQAVQIVPQEFEQQNKEYVVNKVYQFCMLAGNALNQDAEITLNAHQANVVCQFIGEWTFHKSIDIMRAEINPELWDTILQQVAFAVFETAKYTQLNNFDPNQSGAAVEKEVRASYEKTLHELAKAGKINADDIPRILSFSNMDKMAEENSRRNQQNTQPEQSPQAVMPDEEKAVKYASIAIFLKSLPQGKVNKIFNSIDEEEAVQIKSFMEMQDLEQKIDPKVADKFLKQFKEIFCRHTDSEPENYCEMILQLKMKYNEVDIRNIVKFERPLIKNYVGLCLDNDRRKLSKINLSHFVAGIVYDYLTSKLAQSS